MNPQHIHQEVGEGKAERTPYFPFYGDDWDSGTIGFTLEQRGFYLEVLRRHWERKGGLPDDVKWLACAIKCSTRKAQSLRNFLVEKGKLIPFWGLLINPRMVRDVQRYLERSARKSSRKDRPMIERSQRDLSENSSETLPEKSTKSKLGPLGKICPESSSSSDPEREERSSSIVRLIDDDDRASTDPPQRKISKAVETALCNREGQERGTAIIAEYLGSDYAKNARVIDRAFVGWLKNTYGVDISVRGTTAPMAEILAMCGSDRNGRPDLTLPKKIRGWP